MAVQNSIPANSLLDEAFLACTSGHCIFDAQGALVSWSESFAELYPDLTDVVDIGLKYRDFLRTLHDRSAIKNLQKLDNVDAWLDQQLAVIGKAPAQFIHHLKDDRYILIRHTPLSNQSWLFAAFDITELHETKRAHQLSKDKFMNFAKIATDWFWELDDNLCYQYHSGHNRPLGGLDPATLVGKPRIIDVASRIIKNDQLDEHINALTEHRAFDVVLSWESADGNFFHSHTMGKPQFDHNGTFVGYLGCGRDVTEFYSLKQKFEYQAQHDELTGIWNRRAFSAHLDKLITACRDGGATDSKTLVCIDLDRFKLVNDSAGHQAGDQLLKELTTIISDGFCEHSVLARLGGDEFSAVIPLNVDQTIATAQRLVNRLSKHQFHWRKRKFSVGACIGVVAIDNTSTDSSDLLSKADIACYSAKASGRNQVQVYSSQSSFQAQQNDELGKVKLLNDAISNDQVKLYLQPIVPTSHIPETRIKFEVLLRVLDPDGNIVPSGDIIRIAEKYDRMQHLDLWVTERALTAIEQMDQRNVNATLSVNLSGNTLSSSNSLKQLVTLVESHQITAGSLCFEITETAAIANIEQVKHSMCELRALGCEFSLDDFGSGLSSFAYLQSLPVEYLKIDGSFVKNILTDNACRAIVSSFNTLGHEMGMKTVAEFVENRDIATTLTELEIDYLQGYYVGMPRDLDDWLADYENAELPLTGT